MDWKNPVRASLLTLSRPYGKEITLSVEALGKMAAEAVGKPFRYEHKGRPIGKIVAAWVEGNKLMYRAAIFKPTDAWTKKGVEEMKAGKLRGVSMSFAYPEDEATADEKDPNPTG